MTTSTPKKITEVLHKALGRLEKFEQCALLDYPDHFNIGDHLIWLGNIFYFTDILKTKINYIASSKDFSEELMKKQIGKAPIFFHGGGSLGDIWPRHQKFREKIILRYQDRPIIILPQSIYFANKVNFKKAVDIFNSHPNLTLFVRDNYSYELALQNFHNCQVILAPDMAFQLVKLPGLSFESNSKQSILYLCREDAELNQSFSFNSIKLPNLVVDDWVSFKWMLANYEVAHGSVREQRLIQEVWQRGLATPKEWVSRQIWQHFHPYAAKFNTLYKPSLHRESWSLMHSGVYQFKQHRLIITNRLHGHILCILLGIPHIFLPNSYHKNKVFYETWTCQIPFCRFVEDAREINKAAQELLEEFSK